MDNHQPMPGPAPLGLNEDSARAKGKRTSAHKIVMFGFTIVLIAVAFSLMAINADNVSQKSQEPAREARATGFADSARLEEELFARASRAQNAPVVQPSPPVAQAAPIPQIILLPPTASAKPAPKPTRPVIVTDAERELAKRYRDMKNNAILSKSGIDGFVEQDEQRQAPEEPRFARPNLAQTLPAYTGEQMPPEMLQSLMRGVNPDSNQQEQKLSFLTQDAGERTPQGYSEHTRKPQIAPLELKAGTVIPGLLITGINSDLPGAVIGQVSENVYDSASGNYLLIPQGARVLGVYDSRITYGQKRAGIVWNRILFPDGSSLNIDGSPGTDLAGYSGIKGRVDNHYGQIFTAALFTSLFAGAADIATGGREVSGSGEGSKSVRDVIVETVGAEVAQIGSKLAERALEIQPTIKIKPGQRFNVLVQQDIVFLQPWNPNGSAVSGF